MLKNEIIAVAIGMLVAALIPAIVLSVGWPLDGSRQFQSIIGTFIVALPFAFGAALVLGIPTFFLLRPFRPGSFWSVALVGFCLGALVQFILLYPVQPPLSIVVRYGILGTVSTIAFWSIWRRSQ